MRVVLTGGCTGGHIYPAIAIGDKLKELVPDCEIIYIAHAYGLETSIVPKAGYKLYTVTADWIERKQPLRIIKTLFKTLIGTIESLRILRNFRPDIIVSTGSFVSVPVVLAGRLIGAKIFIHEQNAFPGVSNRLLARFSEKVFVGFPKASQYFDNCEVVVSGNPIRQDFEIRDYTIDRKSLGIKSSQFMILIFGGSLGATVISEIGKALAEKFQGDSKISLYFATGKNYYDEVMDSLGKISERNIIIKPFIDDMSLYLSASDLVISRAGAITTSEILSLGKPAIFIPSSHVAEDHQYLNASTVAAASAAYVVREEEASPDRIIGIVQDLIQDKSRLKTMTEAASKLSLNDASSIICQEIIKSTTK